MVQHRRKRNNFVEKQIINLIQIRFSSADFGSNGLNLPSAPCNSVCTGKADVAIDNQQGVIFNYSVNVNNVFNGTTNIAGLYEINFNSVFCGDTQTISVYCNNDQSKLCESKISSMDFNGDVDNLVFNCNICNNDKNLEISLSDIDYMHTSGNTYQFNITINNENVAGTFNVTIKGQSKLTGLITSEEDSITTISNSSKDTHNVLISIDTYNIDYFHVYADTQDQIKEAEEKDNYVIVPLVKIKPKAYLVVGTGNSKADDAIKGYLKLFVQEVAENQAELVIAVGNPNFNSKVNQWNSHTATLKWYFDKTKNVPVFNNQPIDKLAYTGLVGRFFNGSLSNLVFAYGTNIEGDVAAVKKLISAKDIFLLTIPLQHEVVIDKYDRIGLSVMDLIHNKENNPYYNAKSGTNGNYFRDIIEDILLDNNFEIAIKTVQTTSGTSYGQNTTLRLKNINSDFSVIFKDAIVNNVKPVVLARGLWSNLLTWEDFGRELASDPQNARDTWLIELTGGPTQDCDTCPNYKYEDLVDYYWPALIAGVQKYSGQNKIDYVAHSNGCRVSLDSLKNWSAGKNNAGYYFDTSTGSYQLMDLASAPVDTFVGVGCPGAFVGQSFFKEFFGNHGDVISQKLSSLTHVSGKDIGKKLIEECKNESTNQRSQCNLIAGKLKELSDSKISKNLAQNYLDSIKSKTDLQSGGTNLTISKVKFIYSIFTEKAKNVINGISYFDHDGVVTANDSLEISNNIISTNQNKTEKFEDKGHTGLTEDKGVLKTIKGFLK